MENLVYLITGANRGLGLALSLDLLSRPHHTVIACFRNAIPDQFCEPHSQKFHLTCKLIPAELDVTDAENYSRLIHDLAAKPEVRHIDVVIACAGASPGYAPVLSTSPEWLESAFAVNCTGALRLLQACKDLLIEPEGRRVGKFVVISSILGSIASQEAGEPVLAYGASKAAVNFLVKRLDCEQKTLVTLVLHPGWVKTDMGQGFADAINVKEPPLTAEQSAAGMLEQIEKATKETTSGKFIDYKGTEIPW